MLTLDKPMIGTEVVRTNGITDANKREMFETFQTWALKTYGDSGKTKTVTRKKYDRIVRILNGEEESCTENSKFRFWVKAKGFKLGSASGGNNGLQNVVFVPVKQATDPKHVQENIKQYKRVAIVDDFFDIIYGVHVEMDGRGGKHAGQKRTYRAIAETYSFLPREAVTRFLMACTDCQKRMHIGTDTPTKHINNNDGNHLVPRINGMTGDHPHIIDFSVPITQTYLNHMRSNGYLPSHGFMDDEDSISSGISEMSTETSPSPVNEGTSPKTELKIETSNSPENGSASLAQLVGTPKPQAMEEYYPLNMSSTPNSLSPASRDESKGHPERKRRASDDSLESSSKASETGTNDESPIKDDDDDNDDEDEDKVPVGSNIDPERLKSFNMFCRLFVDENLDRMVPISKQPKDKVQAILDACDRQFPEFHIRSRKRIRTYLKSCRRMRRSKENGWEPLRPTPPHLTSAAAESYLAQACENESVNAKRMRMGLEPLPAASMPITHHPPPPSVSSQPLAVTQKPVPSPAQPSPPRQETKEHRESTQQSATTPTPTHVDRHTPVSVQSATEFIRHHTPPTAFRPPPEFPPFFANGNGLFRPGFPGYQHPAHHHPAVLHSPIQPATLQNGPTDLSMKKQSSKNQLSTSEIATIKQLISGYRESAAFLYRSADELEQLLLQQN